MFDEQPEWDSSTKKWMDRNRQNTKSVTCLTDKKQFGGFGKKESFDYWDVQKLNSTTHVNWYDDDLSPEMKDSWTSKDSEFKKFKNSSKTGRPR